MLSTTALPAADLIATGGWTETVDASDLSGGAGTDLNGVYESGPGATTLTVSAAPGTWRIRARRVEVSWDSRLTVWVKRVSDGSGSGTIAGGSSYVQLGTTDTEIFSGTEDRNNISLQYKVTGLSKNIQPGTYLTDIVFTVTQ